MCNSLDCLINSFIVRFTKRPYIIASHHSARTGKPRMGISRQHLLPNDQVRVPGTSDELLLTGVL